MDLLDFSFFRAFLFLVVVIIAFSLLTRSLIRLYKIIRLGKDEDRFDKPLQRIAKTISIAIFQKKILKREEAGVIHAFIFWGFLVLLFSATESIIQGFYPRFSWDVLGALNYALSFSTDAFNVLISMAVITALSRRFLFKEKRLQLSKKESRDAAAVLVSILTIVSSLSVHIASREILFPSEYSAHFMQYLLSPILSDSPTFAFEFSWWLHILAIFAFMNYLPYSKHLHVYTAIPNVYYSDDSQKALSKINFEDETIEKYGADSISDLSWKHLLDSFSCTHCGRCDEVCPANRCGMALSPRQLWIQVREACEAENPEEAKLKISNISDEALWQCTTCSACMNECPVNNEHIPPIVELRRHRVMMEADFPANLQTVFENLESTGSPWAVDGDRLAWTNGLEVKTVEDTPDFDILFWVGCAGAFDAKAMRTARAMIKILDSANINYAILGNLEQCNGDIARRAGNEYLASMLITQNIETFKQFGVKRVLTFCPHCFNTFKNEYTAFGYKLDVIHHTEFINELIENKLIYLNHKDLQKYAYHDSCYLGRYNDIYSAPREILNASVSGLVEPSHTLCDSTCCGAGGGGAFLENKGDSTINLMRTKELVETGCDAIATNCPFCTIMIDDGLKSLSSDIKTKDIAEIVAKLM